MFLKNRNISSKIKRSKVTDYAAIKITVLYSRALSTEPIFHYCGIYIYCDIKYHVHFRICTYGGDRRYIYESNIQYIQVDMIHFSEQVRLVELESEHRRVQQCARCTGIMLYRHIGTRTTSALVELSSGIISV